MILLAHGEIQDGHAEATPTPPPNIGMPGPPHLSQEKIAYSEPGNPNPSSTFLPVAIGILGIVALVALLAFYLLKQRRI